MCIYVYAYTYMSVHTRKNIYAKFLMFGINWAYHGLSSASWLLKINALVAIGRVRTCSTRAQWISSYLHGCVRKLCIHYFRVYIPTTVPIMDTRTWIPLGRRSAQVSSIKDHTWINMGILSFASIYNSASACVRSSSVAAHLDSYTLLSLDKKIRNLYDMVCR